MPRKTVQRNHRVYEKLESGKGRKPQLTLDVIRSQVLPGRAVPPGLDRLPPAQAVVKVGSDGRKESAHYGGADNPHETIKCLEAWGLERDALLWNAVKYISRAGKKEESPLSDLKKALYYLKRRVEKLEASVAAAEKRGT